MAQVKKSKATTRNWSGAKAKPSRMKPDRTVVAKKPKVLVVPDTKDDLLRQVGLVFDKVDVKLAGRNEKQPGVNRWDQKNIGLTRWDRFVGEEVKSFESLMERLEKVLDEKIDPRALVKAMFGAVPGTVPSWSRPGTFLLWIGYIPCRCIWGGMTDPSADIVAADPKEKWISPGGSASGRTSILPDDASVKAIFHDWLTQQTLRRNVKHTRSNAYNGSAKDLGPAFDLYTLSGIGREATEQELARPENAWLVAALKRGPVDAIPLPPHLSAIQMSWLA